MAEQPNLPFVPEARPQVRPRPSENAVKENGLWDQREIVLLSSLLAILILFVITGVAAEAFHDKQRALGLEWFRKGITALQENRPQEAIEALRTALVYSRANTLYQARLATALMAVGRKSEAEFYLLNILRREPGNSNINLELAHLVEDKDPASAANYYRSAIVGFWEQDAALNRRQARVELIRVLRRLGQSERVESQIIALAADLPDDVNSLLLVGDLFAQSGDYDRALSQYRTALTLDGNNTRALIGAGEAAFAVGKYREAQPYLEKAARVAPDNARVRELAQLTRLIRTMDPLQRGISASESARRTIAAFNQGRRRLQSCSASLEADGAALPAALARAIERGKDLAPQIRAPNLRASPDLVNVVAEFAFEAQEQAAQACGDPSGQDRALLLIGRMHRSSEQ